MSSVLRKTLTIRGRSRLLLHEERQPFFGRELFFTVRIPAMKLQKFASAVVLSVMCVQACLFIPTARAEVGVLRVFETPVDAFSVRMPEADAVVRYQVQSHGTWSTWQELSMDEDAPPSQVESDLVMLPEDTTALRVTGIASPQDIHPITVSHEPVKTRVASLVALGAKTVVSRTDWGAEEDYLFYTPAPETSASDTDSAKGDNGGGSTQVSQRVSDCQQAQVNYPDEFKYAATVTKDAQGRNYLWPLQYSKNVKLLTVHHTALGVKNDPRPAVERVRALYKYHAVSKGWGDIGYHFIVDENGVVYEGRTGGKGVVGGHAYCNNTGTIGIVLMGNFENEQPTQKQVQGLQRLLFDLAQEYNIDTKKSVQFHGKVFDAPIVRHRDLLSTLCPGYYVAEAFGQVVKNVQTGNVNGTVNFPKISGASSSTSSVRPQTSALGLQEGIAFTGRTTISSNPGGKQRLSFTYTAGTDGAYEGKRIADVSIYSSQVKLYVDDGFNWVPVTKGVLLPTDLPAYETVSVQMIVEAPMDAGNYLFEIAGIRFELAVSGRRVRTGTYQSPFYTTARSIVRSSTPSPSTPVLGRVRPQSRRTLQSGAASSVSSSTSSTTFVQSPAASVIADASSEIRVKLSASQNPVLRFASSGTADGVPVGAGTELSLVTKSGQCEAQSRGVRFASGPILRFLSPVPLTVAGVAGKTRSYRGTLECRVINGSLVLINELPIESYLRGLAEEPDSEPYQKQRAFAIAARTYAAYYLSSDHRKFAGMPYDGSDSPAEFQAYAGVEFEAANPRWLQAVESTSHQVLRYKGELFKPAYFSSDDGRTRSPEEIGWKNFPAAAVFQSKKDPWCNGMTMRGHGVGMSGCGALGQANEGKSAEQILDYYYPGSVITSLLR